MKKLIALSAITILMVATSTANAQTVLRLPHKPFSQMNNAQKVSYLRKQIRHDHSIIRFYKHHRTLQSTELAGAAKWAKISLRIASANLRKLTAVSRVASGSDMGAWLCIHRYEGGWGQIGYVHGVATYFGGLQMDMGFQRTYGSEFLSRYGTANHWPIIDQIIAARRARDGYGGYGARGYGPWPNTARYCGLF